MSSYEIQGDPGNVTGIWRRRRAFQQGPHEIGEGEGLCSPGSILTSILRSRPGLPWCRPMSPCFRTAPVPSGDGFRNPEARMVFRSGGW